jgi:hypothetical protein
MRGKKKLKSDITGINSTVTGKFSDPPVRMNGITSRFISRPAPYFIILLCLLPDDFICQGESVVPNECS